MLPPACRNLGKSTCAADLEGTCVVLQGEAIAVNLREMFGFEVPILSVVIGEGGSGGALAIGCANHNLIMEHSVYYVASPEACAAILWKSRDKAATVRTPHPSILSFSYLQHVLPRKILDKIILADCAF